MNRTDCSADWRSAGRGNYLFNLEARQLKLEYYADSLPTNQAALAIFQTIDDRASETEALRNLAELDRASGEIEEAQHYCQQALRLAVELDVHSA